MLQYMVKAERSNDLLCAPHPISAHRAAALIQEMRFVVQRFTKISLVFIAYFFLVEFESEFRTT